MTPQEILRAKTRTAANPMDYKRVIVERSFNKDWKPVALPCMEQFGAPVAQHVPRSDQRNRGG